MDVLLRRGEREGRLDWRVLFLSEELDERVRLLRSRAPSRVCSVVGGRSFDEAVRTVLADGGRDFRFGPSGDYLNGLDAFVVYRVDSESLPVRLREFDVLLYSGISVHYPAPGHFGDEVEVAEDEWT